MLRNAPALRCAQRHRNVWFPPGSAPALVNDSSESCDRYATSWPPAEDTDVMGRAAPAAAMASTRSASRRRLGEGVSETARGGSTARRRGGAGRPCARFRSNLRLIFANGSGADASAMAAAGPAAISTLFRRPGGCSGFVTASPCTCGDPSSARRRRSSMIFAETSRGAAAAGTRIIRGDESRLRRDGDADNPRRRGRDVGIPRRRAAATPGRLPLEDRGRSADAPPTASRSPRRPAETAGVPPRPSRGRLGCSGPPR